MTALVHSIGIVCVQEHRYLHSELEIKYHDIGICMEKLCQRRRRGCRDASQSTHPKISQQHRKNTTKNDRTTFNGNPSTMIISCYSLTNVNDKKDLNTFYNDISSLVRIIPKHNVLVIKVDIISQIGKNENKKFSLQKSPSRNGEYLTAFSQENGIFRKRKESYGHTLTKIMLNQK